MTESQSLWQNNDYNRALLSWSKEKKKEKKNLQCVGSFWKHDETTRQALYRSNTIQQPAPLKHANFSQSTFMLRRVLTKA